MNSSMVPSTPVIKRSKEYIEGNPSPHPASILLNGNDSFSSVLDSPDMLNEAIVSPPPSNTRRWKNKKHWQTIAGHKRYQLATAGPVYTPEGAMASDRRVEIRDSLKRIIDAVDKPEL
jgi:hypothetical protein